MGIVIFQSTKRFCLGNITRRVQIEPIPRRAMRLIPRELAPCVRPFHPRHDQFLMYQVAQGFAIIAFHPRDRLGIAFSGEFPPMIFQPITTRLREFCEQTIAPIAVVFKRILKRRSNQSVRKRCCLFSPISKIARDRISRKRIDRVAFSSRRGTLHLFAQQPHGLARLSDIDFRIALSAIHTRTTHPPARSRWQINSQPQPLGFLDGKGHGR